MTHDQPTLPTDLHEFADCPMFVFMGPNKKIWNAGGWRDKGKADAHQVAHRPLLTFAQAVQALRDNPLARHVAMRPDGHTVTIDYDDPEGLAAFRRRFPECGEPRMATTKGGHFRWRIPPGTDYTGWHGDGESSPLGIKGVDVIGDTWKCVRVWGADMRDLRPGEPLEDVPASLAQALTEGAKKKASRPPSGARVCVLPGERRKTMTMVCRELLKQNLRLDLECHLHEALYLANTYIPEYPPNPWPDADHSRHAVISEMLETWRPQLRADCLRSVSEADPPKVPLSQPYDWRTLVKTALHYTGYSLRREVLTGNIFFTHPERGFNVWEESHEKALWTWIATHGCWHFTLEYQATKNDEGSTRHAWALCAPEKKFAISVDQLSRTIDAVADESPFSLLHEELAKVEHVRMTTREAHECLLEYVWLFLEADGDDSKTLIEELFFRIPVVWMQRAEWELEKARGHQGDRAYPEFNMTPVLTSRARSGKSGFLRHFLPHESLHTESFSLADDQQTKAENIRGCLFVEIADSQGMNRADIDDFTGFVTRTSDKYREKYGRRRSTHRRASVFCLTRNPDQKFEITEGAMARYVCVNILQHPHFAEEYQDAPRTTREQQDTDGRSGGQSSKWMERQWTGMRNWTNRDDGSVVQASARSLVLKAASIQAALQPGDRYFVDVAGLGPHCFELQKQMAMQTEGEHPLIDKAVDAVFEELTSEVDPLNPYATNGQGHVTPNAHGGIDIDKATFDAMLAKHLNISSPNAHDLRRFAMGVERRKQGTAERVRKEGERTRVYRFVSFVQQVKPSHGKGLPEVPSDTKDCPEDIWTI